MKILVIDDHPLIQEALRHVLAALDPSLEFIQAQDASETHAALSREPDTDLILLDLALPGCDGFELLSELRREWPGMPVLVLSATHDRETVEHALDLGAMGFIPKTANTRVLLEALQLVLAGGVYVPSESAHPCANVRSRSAVTRPEQLGLTLRQADVLKLLVQGKPNKLICRDLTLSEGTVKVHVSAILKALRVHSRTEAIAVLARRGISVDTLAARRADPGSTAR